MNLDLLKGCNVLCIEKVENLIFLREAVKNIYLRGGTANTLPSDVHDSHSLVLRYPDFRISKCKF